MEQGELENVAAHEPVVPGRDRWRLAVLVQGGFPFA
jgi:hypothetical protein